MAGPSRGMGCTHGGMSVLCDEVGVEKVQERVGEQVRMWGWKGKMSKVRGEKFFRSGRKGAGLHTMTNGM